MESSRASLRSVLDDYDLGFEDMLCGKFTYEAYIPLAVYICVCTHEHACNLCCFSLSYEMILTPNKKVLFRTIEALSSPPLQ